MLSETELLYRIALQKLPNLGDASAKKLIDRIGSAEAIFKQKENSLLKIDGIGLHKIKYLNDSSYLDEAEKELHYIQTNKIDVSTFDEKEGYPSLLKHCLDGPILLFKRGNIDIQNKKIISIVGTRKITSYGMQFCKQLIADLAVLNPVIVSGFAYGVDITAQKAAIEHNLQTIGCLAHGLDQLYPKAHAKYAPDIEKNGGFITDFCSDDSFDRNNFLKRNRIIAGISEATIVIESADKGGSLVTADIANSYNREVFAVPGRTTDKLSLGCNNLIKKHQAKLITSAADLIYHLNWDIEAKPVQQTQLFVELNETEQKIADKLQEVGKCELDQLSLHTEIPTYQLASLLLNLELKGVVKPLPGKQFELIN
ncbi:DNA-processing protein DprA [Psychroflexus salis]|uniref:DNA processing protein DprA n=1 Tax=Psychroflexus salis TaxID=1526574 RepID=A0A916ZQW9_9FLAO|nr:DNA-processing protein DprA [Psychroflexus salis]GGE08536.1 DNA processing protein DprA [Psychroflexus salis]